MCKRSSTLRLTTSHPWSWLSMARLNMARSRVRPAICSLVRIDQTCFGQFAFIPGFAARSLRDRIFRVLHGRAPLLQRMTSLHHRLSGPSEVAWQSLATDTVVRGSSGPTSVIPGLLSLTVTGIASNPTVSDAPPMSLFMAHEISGTAAACVGRQRSQSAHSTVEDPALRC